MVLLALISVPSRLGYLALALLVGLESGGVPLPGETALVTAGVLAGNGDLRIETVIAVGAAAAIIGDNIGYLLGRRLGRHFLERPGRTYSRRMAFLGRAEVFFDRHGPKAVFLGRWVTVLRIWAAWLAGATAMPWRSFVLWNALGGITWAAGASLLGYALGHAAEGIVGTGGAAAAVLVVLVAGGLYVRHRVRRRAASLSVQSADRGPR